MEQQCEDCGEYKEAVFRRADIPRLLCSDCYVKALVSDRPSKYIFVPSYMKGGNKATLRPPPPRDGSNEEIQG